MGDHVGPDRPQRTAERSFIQQIAFDQRSPTHELAPSAGQVVVDDHFPSRRGEGLAAMASDISGAAGDKHNRLHPVSTVSDCAGTSPKALSNSSK